MELLTMAANAMHEGVTTANRLYIETMNVSAVYLNYNSSAAKRHHFPARKFSHALVHFVEYRQTQQTCVFLRR